MKRYNHRQVILLSNDRNGFKLFRYFFTKCPQPSLIPADDSVNNLNFIYKEPVKNDESKRY